MNRIIKKVDRIMEKLKNQIPNAITSLRLLVLPHLVYSFNHQFTMATCALFLFAIGTDLADGYVARKLNATSKLGGYLDVILDFTFISGMYLNFIVKQMYSPWILVIIIGVFIQFVLSNLYLKKTVYDPVGKYYGSLLFIGVGLTILFSNQLVYDFVTYGIIISTIISLTSRISHLIKGNRLDKYTIKRNE
jgi:CDP-diacylglycerol--glycerol-3-phosphate 3-phosphatidyltransferase/cardiolipin synthase